MHPILLLNNRKSVPVSHGYQHQTSGSFDAKMSTDIQQTWHFYDFLRFFTARQHSLLCRALY